MLDIAKLLPQINRAISVAQEKSGVIENAEVVRLQTLLSRAGLSAAAVGSWPTLALSDMRTLFSYVLRNIASNADAQWLADEILARTSLATEGRQSAMQKLLDFVIAQQIIADGNFTEAELPDIRDLATRHSAISLTAKLEDVLAVLGNIGAEISFITEQASPRTIGGNPDLEKLESIMAREILDSDTAWLQEMVAKYALPSAETKNLQQIMAELHARMLAAVPGPLTEVASVSQITESRETTTVSQQLLTTRVYEAFVMMSAILLMDSLFLDLQQAFLRKK